jgi:hypothetical protein
MTHVQIDLPDGLADEAKRAGLLAPEKIADMLRAELSEQRVERMRAARTELRRDPLPRMSQVEIEAEITAYRSEKRHAGRP